MWRNEPIISTVRRDQLDACMADAAVSCGADLFDSLPVESCRESGNGILVKAGGLCLQALFLIGADGAIGPVASMMGFADRRVLVPALEAEIRPDSSSPMWPEHVARFDIDVPFWGYGWMFPKSDHITAGLIRFRRERIDLPAHLSSYLKQLGL